MRLRTVLTYAAIILLFGSAPLQTATAQERGAGEYQVKAAMLYNLVKFVDWPQKSAGNDLAPFKSCVIGKNPFGPALDSLNGKTVKGRKLLSVQLSRIDEISACQMLFISGSEKRKLAEILETAHRHNVLTISDIERFAASGGMIGLVDIEGKVRLEANLDAVRQTDLKISSQLLKLARIVKGAD